MDTTAIIVVVIFVFSIFGSLGGKTPPKYSFQDYGTIVAAQELTSLSNVPEPDFSDPSNDAKAKIQSFIEKLCRKKKRDASDAPAMAQYIVKYSQQYNVNPKLVTGLIARESGFNPNATSSHGAQGLGQLLPSTAASMGVDGYNPEQNIQGTVRYLRSLLDRWKGSSAQVSLSLASYVEGPNSVKGKQGCSVASKGYIKDIYDYASQI